MKEGQGSRTAERVAARRAAHQLLDDPLVFEDPFAFRVLDPEVAARVRADPRAYDSSRAAAYLRIALAVRSRYAEDELREAVLRGCAQYVVLGAGFDTFALRNPYARLRVFEVDHPDTQNAKRRRLVDAAIAPAADTVYVPVDFAKTTLERELDAAGFDRGAPAFFSWLGVVPYLEREAIAHTLRFIATQNGETTVVFDYGTPPHELSFFGRLVFDAMAARVAAAGEPWKSFFAPAELRALLHDAGFTQIEDLGPAELNARYLDQRPDGLRVGEMMHLAKASVVASP